MNGKMMVMCAVAGVALAASAKIEMGAPFTDGAVLQRGMKVPVWGRATPEENTAPARVTVSFAGQEKSVTADPVTGAWKVELDPLTASKEGQTLTVTQESDCWFARLFGSAADAVEVKDVLIGEVWLASGQSNMECPIWGAGSRYRDGNGGLLTQMTHLPFVRYVSVDRRASAQPVSVRATWKRFVPEDLTASPTRSPIPSPSAIWAGTGRRARCTTRRRCRWVRSRPMIRIDRLAAMSADGTRGGGNLCRQDTVIQMTRRE